MRSLVVAMNERMELIEKGEARVFVPEENDSAPYTLQRVEFTKEHKKNHTILAPQMAPIQFEMIESVFHKHGYKLKLLQFVLQNIESIFVEKVCLFLIYNLLNILINFHHLYNP